MARVIRPAGLWKRQPKYAHRYRNPLLHKALDCMAEGVLCRDELRVKDGRGVECVFYCTRTPLHRGYHRAALGPVGYMKNLHMSWPATESLADQVP